MSDKQTEPTPLTPPFKVHIEIVRNGLKVHTGNLVSETTKGYRVSFGKWNQCTEWFAKDSANVKSRVVEE